MGSVFGSSIKFSLFGESHGEYIGATIDNFPCGIELDYNFIKSEIKRRKANNSGLTTNRIEDDDFEIISGVLNNKTTGSPITVLIKNNNIRSSDYSDFSNIPRPSHSDYTASIRYNNFNDIRGGGHFSARITAPMVVIGALVKIALREKFNIQIASHIKQIYNIKDSYNTVNRFLSYDDFILNNNKDLPVFNNDSMIQMINAIQKAKEEGDSLGGIISVFVFGVEAGLGSPFFESIESRLGQSIFAIPAVKGVEFGLGFDFVNYKGSECNDVYFYDDNKIKTKTNNNGGILGGISTGMPIIINISIKPTSSISKTQYTLNVKTKEEEKLNIKGRHDPCIAVRCPVILESAVAISLLDLCIDMRGHIL